MKLKNSLIALLLTLLINSCTQQHRVFEGATGKLYFSTDTINLDTIFTTFATTTKQLTIYNHSNNNIIFDAYVGGGEMSPFKINIDGESAHRFSSLEIAGKDSCFCYITAFLNRQTKSSPTHYQDSILFLLRDGTIQKVTLVTHGQDVIVLRNEIIMSDTTLTDEYPYYIFDTLYISPNCRLNIEPGVTLYMHKNASIIADGYINAVGSIEKPIEIRGSRRDMLIENEKLSYDDIPGQWEGIHLTSKSYNNIFKNCNIRNTNYGIVADSSDVTIPKLTIDKSYITNSTHNALDLNHCNSFISNSLIANAEISCINITGGHHIFEFCTIANFYLWAIHNSAVSISSNENKDSNKSAMARFSNCIITGSHTDEFFTDTLSHYLINNSLVMISDTTSPHITNSIYEHKGAIRYGKTQFMMIASTGYRYNFRLDSLSTAIGLADTTLLDRHPTDILGCLRKRERCDAGCFQTPY